MWERTLTIGSAGKTFSVTGWKVREYGGGGEPSLYNHWRERLAWESGKGLAGPPRASPSPYVLGPGGLGPWPGQPHEAPAYCAPELHLSLCHAVPGEGRGQEWAWPGEGRAQIGAGQERPSGQLQGQVTPDLLHKDSQSPVPSKGRGCSRVDDSSLTASQLRKHSQ